MVANQPPESFDPSSFSYAYTRLTYYCKSDSNLATPLASVSHTNANALQRVWFWTDWKAASDSRLFA